MAGPAIRICRVIRRYLSHCIKVANHVEFVGKNVETLGQRAVPDCMQADFAMRLCTTVCFYSLRLFTHLGLLSMKHDNCTTICENACRYIRDVYSGPRAWHYQPHHQKVLTTIERNLMSSSSLMYQARDGLEGGCLYHQDLLASGKRYHQRFSTNRFETCRTVYAGFCML